MCVCVLHTKYFGLLFLCDSVIQDTKQIIQAQLSGNSESYLKVLNEYLL